MQDRYLFRAKRIDNGEFVIGNYQRRFDLLGNEEHYIFCSKSHNAWEYAEVDPSTICQCTGLKDRNGKLIWENDIVVTVYDGNQNPNYVVIWDKDDLGFLATNGKDHYETNFEYLGCCEEIEVIGNIFDNPELLEQEG